MKITRSEFLRWTMASSGLLSGGSQAKANPLGLPIGLQPYTVRKQLESDFLGTLKKVYDMGYREIELSGGPAYDGFYGQKPPEVKRRATPFSAASVPDQVIRALRLRPPPTRAGETNPPPSLPILRAGRAIFVPTLWKLVHNRPERTVVAARGTSVRRGGHACTSRPMWPTCWATGASSPSSGESSNGHPAWSRCATNSSRNLST